MNDYTNNPPPAGNGSPAPPPSGSYGQQTPPQGLPAYNPQSLPSGQQTHQVPPYSPGTYTPGGGYLPGGRQAPSYGGAQPKRERTLVAIILIGAGLLFLLQGFTLFTDIGSYIMLLLGAVFLYGYFTTHSGLRIGFLIPGSILLGIGVGEVLSTLPFVGTWGPHNLSGLTLGLGFCLIWILERRHWWALIPGGILVITSLSEGWMIGRLWPLILVALGGYLLYEQYRKRQIH